jgi:hypothetical protein
MRLSLKKAAYAAVVRLEQAIPVSRSFSPDVGYERYYTRRFSEVLGKEVKVRGIPHLAKNERDMGHGGFSLQVQHFQNRR